MPLFFHPEPQNFNLWHLLIGFLGLVLSNDIENEQRREPEWNYWKTLNESSPSTFWAMTTVGAFWIPGLNLFISIPPLGSLVACIIGYGCNCHSIASTFGIMSSSFYMGRAHDFTVCSMVAVAAFFTAPFFGLVFRSTVDTYWVKASAVIAIQVLLTAWTVYNPPFIRDIFLMLLKKYAKPKRIETLQTCSSFSKFMTAFEIGPAFYNIVTLRAIRQMPIHRRGSQVFYDVVNPERFNVSLSDVMTTVTDFLEGATNVISCRVSYHTATPTPKGMDYINFGSPEYRLIDSMRGNREPITLEEIFSLNREVFTNEVVDCCVEKKWYRKGKNTGRGSTYATTTIAPRDDRLKNLLENLVSGRYVAEQDLRPYRSRGLYTAELSISGYIRTAHSGTADSSDFSISVHCWQCYS